MKVNRVVKVLAILAVSVFIVSFAWNLLINRARLIDNFYKDLKAVTIQCPGENGDYRNVTITDKETMMMIYREIETSMVCKVMELEDNSPTYGGDTMIWLYFEDYESSSPVYYDQYFQTGRTELIWANSELTSNYEYGWGKYDDDGNLIIFTNPKLCEMVNEVISE